MDRKLKVLHVTESYGGGVTSAINTYAMHSQMYEHYLFASVRASDVTGEEGGGAFCGTQIVSRNIFSLLKLRKHIKDINPDAIHIHSTYAGFFCRVMPFIDKAKVIYTPHGFAFLRKDNRFVLLLYYWMECLLSRRTRFIAGCGRHEKELAELIIGKNAAIEIINISSAMLASEPYTIKEKKCKPVVGMVGRITQQKGYDFFMEVAKQSSGVSHFKWIGGGDEKLVNELRSAGIEVTGWLSRESVISHMRGLDLYLHTAAWDGFPISVLEAAQLKLPIMLREIGPFTAEGLFTVDSASKSSDEIARFFQGDKASFDKCETNAKKINGYHSAEKLSNSLCALYNCFLFN